MRPFDEMLVNDEGVRQPYRSYEKWFAGQDRAQLSEKATDAERAFRRTGITFNVYGDEEATERLIPFDIIPRIISGSEWRRLEQGIVIELIDGLDSYIDDLTLKTVPGASHWIVHEQPALVARLLTDFLDASAGL